MSSHVKFTLTFPLAMLALAVAEGRVHIVPPMSSRVPVVPDPSMPPNTLELRSGAQRVRVRWVDEEAELDRWADDGGRS